MSVQRELNERTCSFQFPIAQEFFVFFSSVNFKAVPIATEPLKWDCVGDCVTVCVGKNGDFWSFFRNISETVQDMTYDTINN